MCIRDRGERIPLTICDYDREQGTVTIVFQTVGASTERMALLKEGDTFRDFVGPLGNPSDFVKEDPEELKKKRILYVAGGVGTAPVYPQVKWLKEHGVKVDVIVGSKTKDCLLYTSVRFQLFSGFLAPRSAFSIFITLVLSNVIMVIPFIGFLFY